MPNMAVIKGPGAAGQDAHGHTQSSILSLMATGKNGLEVAQSACEIVSRLESIVSPDMLKSDPYQLAEHLRICVVEHMHYVRQHIWSNFYSNDSDRV